MTPLHGLAYCIALFMLGVLLAVGGTLLAMLYAACDDSDYPTPAWLRVLTVLGMSFILTSALLLAPLTGLWWAITRLPI
jgi:hypothetical protein